MHRAIKIQSERGFTMVEMIVVTVLLALMGSIVYSALNGMIVAKELIDTQRASYQTARYVMNRLNKELSSRLPVPIADPLKISKAPLLANRLIVGEDKQKGSGDADLITFVTVGDKGSVELTYSLEESEERQKSSKEKTYLLVRTEIPAAVKDKKTAEENYNEEVVAEDVVSFNVRYHNGDEWKKAWKATDRGLPKAIEVSLVLSRSGEAKDNFKTAFAISRSDQIDTVRPYL